LGWNNPDLLAVCRLYYHVCVKRLWDKICGVSFVARFMDVCAGFLTNALMLTFLAGMSYFISFFDTTTSKRGFPIRVMHGQILFTQYCQSTEGNIGSVKT